MKTRGVKIVLLAFVTSGCASSQPADKQVVQGVWPDTEWAPSTPTAEGIDPAAVDSLVADLEAGVYGLVDDFLLIRHGRVVADHHFPHDYVAIAAAYDSINHQYNYDHPEWHPFYQDSDLHTLQSVTKSVTSAAFGIAIDKGFIEGVDVPAMSFFNDYAPDTSDARKRAMTLKDLLTMRSGIGWNEMISYDDATNSAILLEASDEWIRYVLDQPMRTEPGTTFDYNSGVSVLLGKIVGVATGQRVDEWTEERLFNPIGITEYYWKITPDGEVDTEGGLYLSTHDLARIGYLFLRGGEWAGERIVSKEWVAASTTPVVTDVRPDNDRADAGYGYQWWVPDHDGQRAEVFAGNGYGGQFVVVAPEHDIIAVFNAWNIHGGDYRSSYRALQERILPALR